MRCRLAAAFVFAILAAVPLFAQPTYNWPGWRGDGTGHCPEKNLLTSWSPTENVKWKVKLPSDGNSSPIVWGDRVFLTQSIDKKGQERAVICFERHKGRELWRKSVPFKGKETTHSTNPYCSSTPATDGTLVVAWHGSAGLVCYDMDGKQLWFRDLGKFEHIWGNASSPVIYQDLVFLNCGPGERQFLLAVNKHTGKDVWQVDEPGGKFGETNAEWTGSWSTPTLAKVDGKDQLIVSWPHVVKAYDPLKGTLLWHCGGLTKLVYTSPLVRSDVIVAMSGFHGSFLALRPGSRDDITKTNRLWQIDERQPQRIGSGVLVGDYIFMANADDKGGAAQCIDLKTGKTLWMKRLGDACWGSIVHADGKLWVTDRLGDTYIFKPSPTDLEIIAKNSLGERVLSTMAVSNGDIFIRTYEHLWCIGK
jgi:outer membrane protein assembly factor BamB